MSGVGRQSCQLHSNSVEVAELDLRGLIGRTPMRDLQERREARRHAGSLAVHCDWPGCLPVCQPLKAKRLYRWHQSGTSLLEQLESMSRLMVAGAPACQPPALMRRCRVSCCVCCLLSPSSQPSASVTAPSQT